MVRLDMHCVPHAVLLLGLIDCALLRVAVSLAIIALAFVDLLLPRSTLWRSTLRYAMAPDGAR